MVGSLLSHSKMLQRGRGPGTTQAHMPMGSGQWEKTNWSIVKTRPNTFSASLPTPPWVTSPSSRMERRKERRLRMCKESTFSFCRLKILAQEGSNAPWQELGEK